jgi:hypothetical protein
MGHEREYSLLFRSIFCILQMLIVRRTVHIFFVMQCEEISRSRRFFVFITFLSNTQKPFHVRFCRLKLGAKKGQIT